MRVLVLGAGGREHALAWAVSQSPLVSEVICAPGNAGIAADVRCAPLDPNDLDATLALARHERAELVVVGPEALLEVGVVDRLEAAGIPAFGPNAEAARLESSKCFAKEFMQRHGIPTAAHRVFDDAGDAERYVEERGGPLVVKPDGLTAGKGVAVCDGPAEARRAVAEIMREGRFGASGASVVIEERLVGEEVSYYALSDGERFVVLPHAQDHKRIFDGDRGENTGSMGAYSPAPVVSEELEQRILERIVRPALDGMRAEGRPYRGVLYVGLMICDGAPLVIEFNARFGDPETQSILFRLESDLVPLLVGCANGRLREAAGRGLRFGGPAVCVMLASKGYPRSYPTGLPIEGLVAAGSRPGLKVFHSGTRFDGGGYVTAGGRVLGVTARGATLGEARDRAYAGVGEIHFEGAQYRSDIGARALGGGSS